MLKKLFYWIEHFRTQPKTLFIAMLVVILSLTSSAWWCFADRQAAVAVILSSDIAPYQQTCQGFEGFFKQRQIALQIYKYNLKHQNTEIIYSQIEKQKPDIIITLGSNALKSVRQRITHIPVVFSLVLNPKELAGSNITGVSLNISGRMQLRKIKMFLPWVKKIGMIYSPDTIQMYNEMLQACKESDCRLISREISQGEDISKALKGISKIDCFLMTPDPDIYFPKTVEYLLIEGLKEKFPVIGLSSYYTRAGALISFECDYQDIGAQTGEIALSILNGQSPDAISIAEPQKIRFSLNLWTAKRLGLEIPEAIIKQASEVFGK
ncbi:ABC transporter substrate-binding protein [Candidatus Desantisbacteria bacterium]|nr:ABC transporter substrate-binding protein [Candidatus Desantisbacteria bacterium]